MAGDGDVTIYVDNDQGGAGAFYVVDENGGAAAVTVIAADANSVTLNTTTTTVTGTLVSSTLNNVANVVISSDTDATHLGSEGVTLRASGTDVLTATSTTTTIYGNLDMDGGTISNSSLLTSGANVVIAADNDNINPGVESVTLRASGIDALSATSTTTTIYGNLNMDSGAISSATSISASGTISTTGAATVGTTLGVTGATTLSGATQINNTLGVTGLITGTGGALISKVGIDDDTAQSMLAVGDFNGATSVLAYTLDNATSNAGLLLVGGNGSALVDMEELGEGESITHNMIGVGDLGTGVRGATVMSINEADSLTYGLQATDGVVTVGVGDANDGNLLHGLTVDNTKTILSGGTSVSGASDANSSSLTLEDAAATLSVGTADTDEIQVLQATNNGTNTSVAIGGNYNVLNNITATAENGVNNITANATSGTNNIEAYTNNIGVATANSINNIGNSNFSSVNNIKGSTYFTSIGTNGAGGQAVSILNIAVGQDENGPTQQEITGYTIDNETGNAGYLNITGNSTTLADIDTTTGMRNIISVGDVLGTRQTIVASVNEGSTRAYGLNALDGRVTVGVTDIDEESMTFQHGLTVDNDKAKLTGGAGALATNGTVGTTSSAGAGAITTYGSAQTIPDGTTINNHLDGKQYQNGVNGNLFVDGNVYINGTLDYVSSDSASTTVFGEEGTSVLPGATQGTSGGTTIVMKGTDGANESMAAMTLTNGYGNTHGLKVYEDRTVLSGGAYSTTMTLRDSGAYFQNTLTGGPAKVTGVADGVDDYDAVNYRQLKKANVGIAAVSAMAAIPGTMPGKRFAIGAGYGHFEGENALAIGLKASIWDRVNVTGAVGLGVGTGDSSATYSASAGVSYSF